MSKCVNEKCKKDPLNSRHAVIVSIDGDMACCRACAVEHEKQQRHFFEVVLHDDQKFADWMGVPVEDVKSKEQDHV